MLYVCYLNCMLQRAWCISINVCQVNSETEINHIIRSKSAGYMASWNCRNEAVRYWNVKTRWSPSYLMTLFKTHTFLPSSCLFCPFLFLLFPSPLPTPPLFSIGICLKALHPSNDHPGSERLCFLQSRNSSKIETLGGLLLNHSILALPKASLDEWPNVDSVCQSAR